jgi:hypothetical protein
MESALVFETSPALIETKSALKEVETNLAVNDNLMDEVDDDMDAIDEQDLDEFLKNKDEELPMLKPSTMEDVDESMNLEEKDDVEEAEKNEDTTEQEGAEEKDKDEKDEEEEDAKEEEAAEEEAAEEVAEEEVAENEAEEKEAEENEEKDEDEDKEEAEPVVPAAGWRCTGRGAVSPSGRSFPEKVSGLRSLVAEGDGEGAEAVRELLAAGQGWARARLPANWLGKQDQKNYLFIAADGARCVGRSKALAHLQALGGGPEEAELVRVWTQLPRGEKKEKKEGKNERKERKEGKENDSTPTRVRTALTERQTGLLKAAFLEVNP